VKRGPLAVLEALAGLLAAAGISGCNVPLEKEPALIRTGTHRDRPVPDAGYYIVHTPVEDLRFKRLDLLGAEKNLWFEVLPFREVRNPVDPPGFCVEYPGEILSLALTRQLERMGCSVVLRMTSHMELALGEEGVRIAGSSRPREFLVHGSASFQVRYSPPMKKVIASLSTDFVFQGVSRDDPKSKTLYFYTNHLDEEETAPYEKLEEAPEKAHAAASVVLDRTVRKILGDPGLENVLAGFVASAGGGAGGAP
jgi:hypothetical protein